MDSRTNHKIEAKAAREARVFYAWEPIYQRYNSITPRETHRRPADHAQAKIDAEAKRARRRLRNAHNFARETYASWLRTMVTSPGA